MGKKGKEEKPPPPCSVTYRLSDPKFITLGYTVLPTEQIMYQQDIYFGYFLKVNDPRFGPDSSTQIYKSGIPFLEVDKKTGSERILYPDGQIAIEYHDNKKTNIGKYTVYGPGPAGYSVLGIFDTLGYGAVYGRCVTTRLSYSQRGGILYETKAKCPVKWSWLTTQRPPKLYVYRDTNLPIIFKVPKKGKGNAASKKSTAKTKSSKSEKDSKGKKGAKDAKPEIVRKVFDPAIEIFEQAALDIMDKHTILEPVPQPIYKATDVLRPMKPIVINLNDNIKLTIINQQNIFLEMSAEEFSTRVELGVILDKSTIVKQALLKVENVTPGVNMLTEAMGPPKSPSVLQILGILGANRMSCNQEARRKKWVRPEVPTLPNSILWKMV